MLDPTQQLMMARGMLQHPQAQSQLQGSAYVSQVEKQAAATTTGLMNLGAGIATTAPIVGSMGLSMAAKKFKSGGMMSAGLTRASSGLGAFDPLSTGMNVFGKVRSGAMTMGGGAAAVGGAFLAAHGVSSSVEYMRGQALEGQRNFLATRSLVRNMPQLGFGQQSVLSPQSRSPLSSPGQVSQLNANIKSIGSQYNMTAGQSRSLMGNMANMGMINTGSVKQMSSSFRSSMAEMQQIAKTIGGDIQEAIATYKAIDRMGFKTSSSRRHVLRQMTTTSAMTGSSIADVHQTMQTTMAAADQLGISRHSASDIANRSMQTTAYMSKTGMLSSKYANSVGGPSGVAQRMALLQLQTVQSAGGLGMISNAFNAAGSFDNKGLASVLSGKKSPLDYSRLAKMDPYAMSEVYDDASQVMGGAILSRVGSINAKWGSKDPLKAKREQFKFMSGMGVRDPQEQLQYLSFLRSQPRSDFMASIQDMRNQAITGRDSSMNVDSSAQGLKSVIEKISSSLSTTLERAGEALIRNWEDTNKKVSTALYGRKRQYGTGVSDMTSMGTVSGQVMNGSYDLDLDNRDVRNLISSPSAMRALSNSANVRGIDAVMRRGLLESMSSKGMYMAAGISGGITRSVNNIAETAFDAKSIGSHRPVGALAEGLGGSVNDGGIYLGRNRRGQASYANPGTYMQMVARDMNAEYDPASGRMIRTDMRRAAMMSSMQGSRFAQNYNQHIGGRISQQLQHQDAYYAGLGGGWKGAMVGAGIGMIGGASMGGIPGAVLGGVAGGFAGGMGGMGLMGGEAAFQYDSGFMGKNGGLIGSIGGGALMGAGIGAMFGGVGAIPGAVIGAGAGAIYNLASGGDSIFSDEYNIHSVLGGYADRSGVARSEILTKGQKKSLFSQRDRILNSEGGDALAQQLYGKNFKDLRGQDRLGFFEMMRRHGGASGKALAGKTRDGMSDSQFNSILSQEASREMLSSFFGVGGQRSARKHGALQEQGALIDIAAAYEGMSHTEQKRLGRMQGMGMEFGFDVEDANMRNRGVQGMLNDFGDSRLGAAYGDLRSVAGDTGGIMNEVTTGRGKGRYLSAGRVMTFIDKIGKRESTGTSERAELARLRKEFEDIFAGAGSGGTVNGKVLESGIRGAQTSLSNFREQFGGELLSGSLIDNGTLRSSALGRVSGVASALSSLAESGPITDQSLRDAMGSFGNRTFFSEEQKQAGLGAMVELSAQRRYMKTNKTAPTPNEMIDLITGEVDILEKNQTLTRGQARDLRRNRGTAFGVLSSEAREKMSSAMGRLNSGGLKELQDLAERSGKGLEMSAQFQFMAAQNNMVQGTMKQTMRRRSDDFESLIGTLGISGFKSSKLGEITDAMSDAKAEGSNILEYLKGGGASSASILTDLQDDINSKITSMGEKGVTTKEDRMRLKLLNESASQLETYQNIAFGGDDFSALASTAVAGGISQTGRGLSLNRGVLQRNFMDVGFSPQKTAAILGSKRVTALEGLMTGKKSIKAREALLAQASGASGMSGDDRLQAIVGTFGGKQGLQGEELESAYNRLVRDTKNPRNNEALEKGISSALDKMFKGYFGPEEEKRSKQKETSEAMLEHLKVMSKAMGSIADGRTVLKVMQVDHSSDGDAGTDKKPNASYP